MYTQNEHTLSQCMFVLLFIHSNRNLKAKIIPTEQRIAQHEQFSP